MGLIDVFEKEDRTEIKLSQLCEMLSAGAKTELLMNAVNCDVPHQYIREMVTGKSEEESTDSEPVEDSHGDDRGRSIEP